MQSARMQRAGRVAQRLWRLETIDDLSTLLV
jgi:hypothetical protein